MKDPHRTLERICKFIMLRAKAEGRSLNRRELDSIMFEYGIIVALCVMDEICELLMNREEYRAFGYVHNLHERLKQEQKQRVMELEPESKG